MAVARGFEPKTKLEHDEKLKVAFFHLLRGWAQHDLAALYGVNPGRINDAVADVRMALHWPKVVDEEQP